MKIGLQHDRDGAAVFEQHLTRFILQTLRVETSAGKKLTRMPSNTRRSC
jgi:hypothetical protein